MQFIFIHTIFGHFIIFTSAVCLSSAVLQNPTPLSFAGRRAFLNHTAGRMKRRIDIRYFSPQVDKPLASYLPTLNFVSFVIRVNRLHPSLSLFFYGLILALWCFSFLLNCFFQFPTIFNNVILYLAKITQNTMIELL